MKKMLPLLLLLIAVGLAYFVMKKKKTSTVYAPTVAGEGLNLNDTDSIIDNTSLSADLNSRAKKWAKNIMKWAAKEDKWSATQLRKQAAENGYTYSQQVVLSAFYQMFASESVITRAQYDALHDELDALSN